MEIKGLKALVTGASGFIGRKLSERLMIEGVNVRALVRRPEEVHGIFPDIAVADVRDINSLRQSCAGIDIIFHLAAITAEVGNWKMFYDVNVRGTQNLIEIARQNQVARFVHMSSVAVYGLDTPGIVDEMTPRRLGGNPYTDSKLLSEEAVWSACREGLQAVILRPTNVYGPGSYTWTIRPVELLRSGRMFLINGGQGICNHLYIDNLLDAITLAAKNDRSVGQAYQINDGHPVTWREFFSHYAKMIGKDHIPSLPLWLARSIGAGSEMYAGIFGGSPKITREAIRFLNRRSRFLIDKATRDLGYDPEITLTEGMARTEKWLREARFIS
ncbi:MAG: NAD-dependent epimerase/dehydratase family protein [Syntrophorhabdus sp.]